MPRGLECSAAFKLYSERFLNGVDTEAEVPVDPSFPNGCSYFLITSLLTFLTLYQKQSKIKTRRQ